MWKRWLFFYFISILQKNQVWAPVAPQKAFRHFPDHLRLQLPHEPQDGIFKSEDKVEISAQVFALVFLLLGQICEQVPLESIICCLLLWRCCANLTSAGELPILLKIGLPVHLEEVFLPPERIGNYFMMLREKNHHVAEFSYKQGKSTWNMKELNFS